LKSRTLVTGLAMTLSLIVGFMCWTVYNYYRTQQVTTYIGVVNVEISNYVDRQRSLAHSIALLDSTPATWAEVRKDKIAAEAKTANIELLAQIKQLQRVTSESDSKAVDQFVQHPELLMQRIHAVKEIDARMREIIQQVMEGQGLLQVDLNLRHFLSQTTFTRRIVEGDRFIHARDIVIAELETGTAAKAEQAFQDLKHISGAAE